MNPETSYTKLEVSFPDYDDPTIINTETVRMEYQKNYYPSLIGPS